MLAFCLTEHHPAAARAAAEILGRAGKSQDLLRGGITAPPLARAARDPDRRLRMAAAEAIANLQPQTPFAGASYLLESLGNLAASSTMGSVTRRVAGAAIWRTPCAASTNAAAIRMKIARS